MFDAAADAVALGAHPLGAYGLESKDTAASRSGPTTSRDVRASRPQLHERTAPPSRALARVVVAVGGIVADAFAGASSSTVDVHLEKALLRARAPLVVVLGLAHGESVLSSVSSLVSVHFTSASSTSAADRRAGGGARLCRRPSVLVG